MKPHREREVARGLSIALDMCEATAIPKRKFKRKKIALSGASNQRKLAGKPIYVYKCRACGCWHLTSLPQHGDRQ
jgi:hypothetical protein